MKLIKYILLFTLFCLLFLSSWFLYSTQNPKKEIGLIGFAKKDADYIMPSVYPNFISVEEAHSILEKTKNNFKDSETVSGFDTSIRKSQTCWIDKHDPVAKSIIMRVCELEGRSFDNAEHLQVVKYEPNGFYRPHHDSCADDNEETKTFLKNGGHRALTMLIYLTDDFEGGATRFVQLEKDVKPVKCSGILFYPLDRQERQCHPLAEHGGLPVLSGQKYIANVWIRQEAFIQ